MANAEYYASKKRRDWKRRRYRKNREKILAQGRDSRVRRITHARALERDRARKRYPSWQKEMALLKGKPCMDCGHTFPPECMDFDHVRGKKLFQISLAQLGRTRKSIQREKVKCDLVCANCHRIRTRKRRQSNARI